MYHLLKMIYLRSFLIYSQTSMKKQRFSKPIGFILCLFAFCQTQAQIPLAPSNVQSPNSASLGLFGKIPVSLYTGIPNIDIPLYNLQQRGVSVSIDLSYHASGFRPDMHPGWVGTGFRLSSGGLVSRMVKDIPDDYSNGNYTNGANMGYYYNKGILNNSNWNQISYMQNIARGNEMIKDTEPDEFSFSFDGYSGSFYLSPDGIWKVKCDKPLSISMNGSFLNIPFTAPPGTRMQIYGMSQSFGGFIITTENGTKYYFGGNTDAIEYSIGLFNQYIDDWVAGSWYLTKIVPMIGEEVSFTYQRDDYINQMYVSIVNDLGTRTKSSGGVINPQPVCNSATYSDMYTSYNGKLVAPVYLSQINGVQTNIKFNRSTSTELRYGAECYAFRYSHWQMSGGGSLGNDFIPILSINGGEHYPKILDKLQWKKLDQIRVERKDGTLIKAFNFGYNNKASERLRLLSVYEQGSDLDSHPPYIFGYDWSQNLPGYLSNMVDHWGFYNGKYADMSNMNNYYSTYYSYREPNATHLYAGTLNKITYPTSAVTELTYEPNYYGKRLQEIRTNGIDLGFQSLGTLSGGLRIKKITSYDPKTPSQKQEKTYYYLKGYSNTANLSTLYSSGVLGGQSKYYFQDYSRSAFNDNGVTYSKALFSSQSVLPGSTNAMGSHIGYSEVVEKLADGSYTKYLFSNFDTGANDLAADNYLQLTRTAYEPYSSTEQERGKVLTETSFDNLDRKVKERSVLYTALNKANEYVPSLKANISSVCPNTSVSVDEGTAYRLYTYSYLPSSETISEYDKGTLLTSVNKEYNYNLTRRLINDESITDSKGKRLKIQYTYPFNTSGSPYNLMTTANILSPVIQKITFLNGTQISGNYTSYNTLGTGYVPVKVEANTLISSPKYTIALADYDDKGNPTSVRKNETDMGVTYIWGYSSQSPIAKLENTTLAAVTSALGGAAAITTFRNIVNPTTTQVKNFLAPLYTLPNAMVTSYAYDPSSGLTQTTDPKEQTTYFDYDAFQRLKNIKDQNGNIIKNINYKYAVYANVERSGVFVKNNCPPNQVGSQVTYTVPAGTYTSTIDLDDANAKAQADIYANGQAYANNHGQCVSSSTVTNVKYTNQTGTYWNVKALNISTGILYTSALGANFSGSAFATLPNGQYTITISPLSSLPSSSTRFTIGSIYQIIQPTFTGSLVYNDATVNSTSSDPFIIVAPASTSSSGDFTSSPGWLLQTYNISTTNGIQVNMAIVITVPANTSGIIWGTANTLGYITGCTPSTQQTLSINENGRIWETIIYPSGQMTINLKSGASPGSGTQLNFNGQYNL